MNNTQNAIDYWLTNGLDGYDFTLLLPFDGTVCNARICAAFEAKLDGRCGVVVEGRNAEDLLALYSLYAFTDKLIIGSFDLPHGRKLRNLLDCGIATEEELINDVILGAM